MYEEKMPTRPPRSVQITRYASYVPWRRSPWATHPTLGAARGAVTHSLQVHGEADAARRRCGIWFLNKEWSWEKVE